MKKNLYILLCPPIFLFIIGCQDILECVVNKHPVLSEKNLKSGQVGTYYIDKINAEIKNEPLDNDYYYYFTVSGDLPEALDLTINYREVVFEGTPTTSGKYSITIQLSVEQTNDYFEECESDLNDCDGLCSKKTSQTYDLVIQ